MHPLSRAKIPLLGCAIVLAIALANWQGSRSPQQRPLPLPQDPFVKAYFNHAESAEYTEPYRKQFRPGDDLEQQIVSAIASAQSTVDVAVQELRLPKIARSLVARHKAGVRVRVILENTYNRPSSDFTADEVAQMTSRESERYREFRQLLDSNGDGSLSPDEINQADALAILANGGVPAIDDTADGTLGSGLMHHKFVIVDNRTLIVTSANFTTSDIHGDFRYPSSRGNANNLLKIQSPELAALFTEEFNIMWGDGPGGNPDSKFGVKKPLRLPKLVRLGSSTVSVQFSPMSATIPWNETVNGLIGKTLSTATRSVDLALFVFSEQPLANILETSHQRGVQVRALIDRGFAYRSYSEGLDMMGVALSDRCKIEADNHPWQQPITTVGVPELPYGDLLHHKFAVVDGHTTIAGSHNWSKAANTNNDETLLVINSPTVAAHFQREFDRFYTNARLGVPATLQQKIQAQQQQCPQLQTASIAPQIPSVNNQLSLDRPSNQNQTFGKVNLNTASLEELEALPGVGPKLAQRIIEARQQKPFTSLEDLDRVPGVGPKLLEKLSDRVKF